MKNQNKYPLIISGNTLISALAGTLQFTTGPVKQNRGNVKWIDIVTSSANKSIRGVFSLTAGPTQLIQNALSDQWVADESITVWKNEYIASDVPPGQTWSITFDNRLGAIGSVIQGRLHLYYHNAYDNEEWRNRRLSFVNKTKFQEFNVLTDGVQKTTNLLITVPTDRGDVVAIQIICGATGNSGGAIENTATVIVNGVSVVDEAAQVIFCTTSNRRSPIMPICIESGSTMELIVTQIVLRSDVWAIRLFFDQSS